MKFICAPDSFKESLTARQAAIAMAQGIRQARPDAEIDLCPIADGGEGTVDALLAATDGEPHRTEVLGPLAASVTAAWGMLGHVAGQPRTAVIEMAAASGLPLTPPHQRDPTKTTTFGTGQLIAAALQANAQRIILGIGGSATTDGGCGAAQALGARFFDQAGQLIDTPITGGMLSSIARIDLTQLDPRLAQTELVIACDVTNPLTGPDGAAHIYGPQKGATTEQVKLLDDGLVHLARIIHHATGRSEQDVPGAGAAGGLGFGAMTMLGGELRKGAQLVLQAVAFDGRVQGRDLCLTGEGKLDGQSLSGKAILAVAQAAAKHGVKTIALVGAADADAGRTIQAGLHDFRVIGEGLSQEQSIARATELLQRAAAEVARQHT